VSSESGEVQKELNKGFKFKVINLSSTTKSNFKRKTKTQPKQEKLKTSRTV